MGTLDYIYRRKLETYRGRIAITSGGWTFAPTKAEIKKVLASGNPHIHESVDGTGKKIYLVSRRSVFCYNPAIGDYPKSSESELWFVPWSVCRKCEHYRKSTRKRRYPACDWRRKRLGGTAGAAKATVKIFEEAVKTADKMIGN